VFSRNRPNLGSVAATTLVLLLSARGQAATIEVPIAVIAGSDQEFPTLSSDWIAWQDGTAAANVWSVRAENRANYVPFTVSPGPAGISHSRARLFGDTVMWLGYPGGKGTLLYDNLADATPPQNLFNQATPQVFGDVNNNSLTVWQETSGSPLLTGNLYGSYIGTNTKFAISTTGNVYLNPVTDGRFVVWREWVGANQLNLMEKDLQTGTTSTLINSGPQAEIDAGIVVYPVSNGIAVRNLLTGQSSTIVTQTPASLSISGDLVVYSVKPLGKTDFDLWGVYLQNGQPFPIISGPGDQVWPDVQGNYAVWSDNRSGDYDVYGAIVPPAPVPEPAAAAALFAAACGLALRRRARPVR
jgi:beta propeller repeat protein